MSSVQKVLLSYEEFARLKDIEQRFDSVNAELTALKEKGKKRGILKKQTGFFV